MSNFLDGIFTIFLVPVLMIIGHGTVEKLMNFKCVEKGNVLEISGWTGGSGDYISKVTTKKEHHDLVVTVHWVLAGIPHPLCPEKKCLHNLDCYPIPLAPDVNRVLLGKKREVIWKRGEANPERDIKNDL